jgi:hypothetical protein
MNNFTKAIAFTILTAGISTAANAQAVSTTATATATIITPIAMAKVNDMDFGNIVGSATGGTVILSPEGLRGGTAVLTAATPGSVAAATFTVTGQAGYAFTFTLPAEGIQLTTDGGGTENEVMDVDTFTSNSTSVLTGGTQTVGVGATLTLKANQTAGVYLSPTPFTVSVNYN